MLSVPGRFFSIFDHIRTALWLMGCIIDAERTAMVGGLFGEEVDGV